MDFLFPLFGTNSCLGSVGSVTMLPLTVTRMDENVRKGVLAGEVSDKATLMFGYFVCQILSHKNSPFHIEGWGFRATVANFYGQS